MIYVLLAGAVILGVVGWVVLELQGGARRVWVDAPGSVLAYRVNFNSSLARVLSRVLRGRDGVAGKYATTPYKAVLVAGPAMTPKQAAHEVAHLVRARDYGRLKWLWRYMTDGGFAAAEEAEAERLGDLWYRMAHFQTYARLEAK